MFNGVIILTNEDLSPSTPGGSVLERAIRRSPGLSRDNFKILNMQQLFELDKYPLTKGLGYKQRVILALGSYPFRTITGLDGEYLNIESIRGYPIEDETNGLVVGSYSPSIITQGSQKLMGVLMLDLRKAVKLAKEGFVKKPLTYVENPTLLDCRSFYEECRDNPDLPIAFDIETPNVNEDGSMPDRIFSIQFSLHPQTGIFFNWIGEEEHIARQILELPNPKLGYNSWRFDAPMLINQGCTINGRHDDILWIFHHAQPDLTTEKKDGENASISSRMGLQYAAGFFGMDFHWKYMKKYKEMAKFYGVADVDALQRMWAELPPQMVKLNIWQGYDKIRYDLEPVLVRMNKRGIPVDNDLRLDLRKIIIEDKDKNFDLMQSLVPLELRNIEPKLGYKKGWKGVKVSEGKIRCEETI